MRTIRFVFLLSVMLCLLILSLSAQSSGDSVGLGVSLGGAFPQGSTDKIASTDWRLSFNWGFYVNIPLIHTFHLTPSSELYQFEDQKATDIALAFKFIVPISSFSLYVGFVPGLTAVSDVIAPHIGVLGGASLNVISNIDLFIQAKYKFLFEAENNIRVLHLNGGILFNF